MGGKRVRIDSKFQPKKCSKPYHFDNDRLSQLPDDVLAAILSFLSVEEAARTSVLSSRWINLWKHTSCLNFDADSVLYKIAKRKKLRSGKRRKFINWVNRVLQTHKALTLKEFRICFDLSRSAQNAITQWLEYAFSRQVQRFELDFSSNRAGVHNSSLSYAFPDEFLAQSSGGVSTLQSPSDTSDIHPLCTLVDFKSLKALFLKGVNVSGEAVEFFLRNCPLLEQLVVHYTEKISNLEVCCSSLRLKHLEICYCYYLKSIKVSAPNLISLALTQVEGLLLENVPMLVEVSINCGVFDLSVKYLPAILSCCISQLEILTLALTDKKVINQLYDFPKMPKLKKLTIDYLTTGDETLIGLSSLIMASPYLQEFVLMLSGNWYAISRSEGKVKNTIRLQLSDNWYALSRLDGEVKNITKFPHQHLKEVKFYGYYGRTRDFELVSYFLENCVVLEKITIDPRYQLFYRHQPKPPAIIVAERTAKSRVKQQLEAEVPQHIELVIL